ncbi:TPA: hypothetical protein HA238_02575 [Candidatus Micrarchaeota archaeon]|nr:hypothetical protein [Candidatus Micrarchaeota archaeon]
MGCALTTARGSSSNSRAVGPAVFFGLFGETKKTLSGGFVFVTGLADGVRFSKDYPGNVTVSLDSRGTHLLFRGSSVNTSQSAAKVLSRTFTSELIEAARKDSGVLDLLHAHPNVLIHLNTE